jgi:dUTP pyrophosphatase
MGLINIIKKIKQVIGIKPIEIKLKKIDERAVIPTYAHDGDVCMDLTAISVEYDMDKDMYIYHTGLAIESDKHYGTFLLPRSSKRKTDAYLCNHVGVVDSCIYRGEIILCFKNRDSLRLIAREAQITEFFNQLDLTNDIKKASICGAKKFLEYTMNEDTAMILAPYKVGDRIAQMVVFPYPNVKIKKVKELSETERGENGFGSTGN